MVATMYEAGGLKVVAVCDGPDAFGACPAVASGEIVPCAGFDIVLAKGEQDPPEGGSGRLHRVPNYFGVCPLSARGAFEAVYAAGEGYFSPFTPDGL